MISRYRPAERVTKIIPLAWRDRLLHLTAHLQREDVTLLRQLHPEMKHAKTNQVVKPVIKLNYAVGFSDGNGVYLEWQAVSETDNLGFFVYRNGAKGYDLASQSMIAGGSLRSSETVVSGGRYSFFDPQGDLSSTYYIESFSAAGRRQVIAQVAPRFLDDLAKVEVLHPDR